MAGKLPKDDRFEFEVRENGLALAFCLKEEGLVPETELTLPEVLAALKSTEIQSKIDEATLSRVIAERPPGWVEISKGTPPKMPTDGRLEYFVDPFHLNASAKQDEKGKIDYKDLNLFLNVTKGQQLVRKHDPIPGEDGTDIFGKPIPCGKAKEVLLKTGPGVEVIEQGHLAVATEDGAITRKSDTVAITRTYDISGDVSYKTGNIEFNGTVNISGNVLTGFKVIQPSPVRAGADEITYPLHILIRFELEKGLLKGDLKAADLPAAWKQLYKHYLGLQPCDDRSGCLQDIHWALGLVGYFPSYLLGSLMAAQIYAALRKSNVPASMADGDFDSARQWLAENCYQQGRVDTPAQILQKATGGPLDAACFVQYLRRKYQETARR